MLVKFSLILVLLLKSLYVASSHLKDCIYSSGCQSSSVRPVCKGDLVVLSDDDCDLITDNFWSSITINEYVCNDITNDLRISNNPCLESITVHSNSLININQLSLEYLPNLVSITCDALSFYNVTNMELKSRHFFYSTRSIFQSFHLFH